ncbi:MAG: hypothetical protein O2894_01200 [Planctomycetota bacterium]|nr:hypothetical protein [Planctomycetota bacterium]
MTARTLFLAGAILAAAVAASGLRAPAAAGDAVSDQAEAEAVKRGEALYRKSWKTGAKACFACHARGANAINGRRLKAYPKYDKELKRVVTAQEKINQMIVSKSGGTALDLGHADLTALEAYISTLR